MRTIILYTACSEDWFVAGPDGDLSWLDEGKTVDYGYQQFYDSLDITLMGGKTYRDILGFDVPFPYPSTTNYVFTRDRSLKTNEHVVFVHDDIPNFVRQLREQPGKDIWLVGGGEINKILHEAGLIDELWAFVHPIKLGGGAPLCEGLMDKGNYQRIVEKEYPNGVVLRKYRFYN